MVVRGPLSWKRGIRLQAVAAHCLCRQARVREDQAGLAHLLRACLLLRTVWVVCYCCPVAVVTPVVAQTSVLAAVVHMAAIP